MHQWNWNVKVLQLPQHDQFSADTQARSQRITSELLNYQFDGSFFQFVKVFERASLQTALFDRQTWKNGCNGMRASFMMLWMNTKCDLCCSRVWFRLNGIEARPNVVCQHMFLQRWKPPRHLWKEYRAVSNLSAIILNEKLWAAFPKYIDQSWKYRKYREIKRFFRITKRRTLCHDMVFDGGWILEWPRCNNDAAIRNKLHDDKT